MLDHDRNTAESCVFEIRRGQRENAPSLITPSPIEAASLFGGLRKNPLSRGGVARRHSSTAPCMRVEKKNRADFFYGGHENRSRLLPDPKLLHQGRSRHPFPSSGRFSEFLATDLSSPRSMNTYSVRQKEDGAQRRTKASGLQINLEFFLTAAKKVQVPRRGCC